MAIFQPRPLQIPGLTTNYGAENSAFSNLGQTLGNLPGDFRKEQLAAKKEQLLGQLASGKADYNKVGLGLVALGDTQGGASLLALGQKQQQLDAQKGIAGIFSGGGASSPSTVGVAPAVSPSASNAPGAGGPAASAPYAAEAQSNGLYVTSAYRGPDHPLTKANPNSAHAQGTAWDLRARTPEEADAVMTKQRGLLSARGLVEGRDYKFIDEVRNPSAHATGPHVHVQLTPEGAARNVSGGVQVAENEADVQRLEQQQSARADLPPQGANATPTQAQGFAVPGNALPPNDPFPRVTTQQLYGILNNPGASPGQQAMAKQIIDNRMKYSDENAPDKREMTRLQTEELRRKVQGDNVRSLITPEERAAAGVEPGYKGTVQIDRQGRLTYPGKPTTEVKNEGPIPPGYRAVRDAAGNLERVEPIPGSKAEKEAQVASEKQQKAERIRAEVGTTVGNALDDIDRLMKSATLPTTGAMGARVANIPGTAAYDIAQALSTIGANISFAQLQQMREASPTGGALGSVSDNEQKLLQNSYAALSQSQSEEQFKTNLGRTRAVFERIVHGRTLTPQERKTGGPMTMERAKGLRDQAAEAIAGGAPRDAVLKRLKEDYGITTDGL